MREGTRRILVAAGARGQRLDQHLALACPDLTRSRLKSLIEEGRVTLSGQKVRPAVRLRGGEEITIELPEAVSAIPKGEDLPLLVLYEDDELVVINKAPGMVVHPAAGNWTGTLVNALLFHVKGLTGIGGEIRPGIVHRLDKDTSGCLVVAKNDAALARLQTSFKERRVTKIYLALVQGEPPKQKSIETLFGRHPVHRKRFTGKVRSGKAAKTSFRVLEQFDGAALLEVELFTGRTHQIRVHLSEAGFPLLGDALYGAGRRATESVKAVAKELGRVALHAQTLSFPHPTTARLITVTAHMPADLSRALEKLRG